ncbi:hypothetical protein SASPL_118575 [Salvia splendens]|uniref:Uncharacterized protein n=1 Tax=Salvia splendens TaxID=180675 RepID=A0A8X8XZM7_SALSN|nr:hypothetical protein SASPL_118575 [Salvia splendens]
MESYCSLTKLEIDAVLQLIHLSGGSDDDLRVFWPDSAVDRYSVADASSVSSGSSSFVNQEILVFDDEPLPRIDHRFGSLVDIYGKTTAAPLNSINNRSKSKKRARFTLALV